MSASMPVACLHTWCHPQLGERLLNLREKLDVAAANATTADAHIASQAKGLGDATARIQAFDIECAYIVMAYIVMARIQAFEVECARTAALLAKYEGVDIEALQVKKKRCLGMPQLCHGSHQSRATQPDPNKKL